MRSLNFPNTGKNLRDRSRYHDELPLPPGGLLPWLTRTGYYKATLADLDRMLDAERTCKRRWCKATLGPHNKTGLCCKHSQRRLRGARSKTTRRRAAPESASPENIQ